MQVEVDQSGKIGDTRAPTVLAFSNGKQHAVFISAMEKRLCLAEMRNRETAPAQIYQKMFVGILYFLLRDHIAALDRVLIDTEYPGQDANIRRQLLNLLRRDRIEVDKEKIVFHQIGKSSSAHHLAIMVFRGKRMPDRMITAQELLDPGK